MTFKSLNIRYVKLIRKMAVMGVGLLLVTGSLLSPTRCSAWATGFNRRPAEADRSIPSLQGAAAITYLKEHKLYDSLRAALPAARTQWGDYSADAQSSVNEQKLTASDGTTNDVFGWSVAISGSTIVVGAQGDSFGDSSFSFQGAAYIFNRQGGSWVEEQKLTASDGEAFDHFGWSVAVSGSTIVVGAPFDAIGGIDQGSAYVFNRQGGGWVETQKLTASDGMARDLFGWSVAVSGPTIVVGAWPDDIGGNIDQGSAYVFNRRGGGWVETQKLTASDGSRDDNFGISVAVSGSTVVVGARGDSIGSSSNSQGAAYVFSRKGGSWVEEQKLTASDATEGAQFGWRVAINGSTIVVGAPFDDIGGNNQQGSVYVFNRQGGGWVETQKLTASDGEAFDQLGWSVAISGSSIVVGANGDDLNQGSVYVFNRQGGSWVKTQVLTASDGVAGDLLGFSLAVSGSTIVAGATEDIIGGKEFQGSAYVFEPWRRVAQ